MDFTEWAWVDANRTARPPRPQQALVGARRDVSLESLDKIVCEGVKAPHELQSLKREPLRSTLTPFLPIGVSPRAHHPHGAASFSRRHGSRKDTHRVEEDVSVHVTRFGRRETGGRGARDTD